MKPQRPAPNQLSLSRRVPRIDLEPLDLVDHQPVVCVVCGGQRTRPTDSQAEPRPCNVCGGQGQIGGWE